MNTFWRQQSDRLRHLSLGAPSKKQYGELNCCDWSSWTADQYSAELFNGLIENWDRAEYHIGWFHGNDVCYDYLKKYGFQDRRKNTSFGHFVFYRQMCMEMNETVLFQNSD